MNNMVMVLAIDAPRKFARVLNTFEDQVIVKFNTGEVKQYHRNKIVEIY